MHPETRIIHVLNFLTPEECDHIIGLVKNSLFRSSVVDVGSTGSKVDEIRTVGGTRQKGSWSHSTTFPPASFRE